MAAPFKLAHEVASYFSHATSALKRQQPLKPFAPLPDWVGTGLRVLRLIALRTGEQLDVVIDELTFEQATAAPPFPLFQLALASLVSPPDSTSISSIGAKVLEASPILRRGAARRRMSLDELGAIPVICASTLARAFQQRTQRPPHRQADQTWRAFHEGLRWTYARHSLPPPTADDLLEISATWGFDDGGPRRRVRRVWEDRLRTLAGEAQSA